MPKKVKAKGEGPQRQAGKSKSEVSNPRSQIARSKSPVPDLLPLRIISGGQTGVDRAALDVAIDLRFAHGGWCPAGRLAEDGRIPARYHLQETESPEYPVRTERNVVESDATLVLAAGRPTGGTDLTVRLARRHGRPCLVIDLSHPPPADKVRGWLRRHRVSALNVAGPRESQNPGIGKRAADFLRQVLASD